MSKLGRQWLNADLILRRPRVTEKATGLSSRAGAGPASRQGGPVYTFEVAVTATKPEVKRAIAELFGVAPKKINISRRRGIKKAMVYLKPGEKIEFV